MLETNSSTVDPSVLAYILKVERREIANCELLSKCKTFESDMLAWNSTLKEKEAIT